MEKWTFLDTGVRSAAENCALDEVLLVCRNKGLIPNTVRFLQFSPNAVLVGFHQSVEQEVRTEYCKKNGIDINRRITGGGTIYLDKPQLGWELIASRDHPLIPKDIDELYERICECTVNGLNRLGVNAAFRPKNDIEVDGRKISGTGGTFEGRAFLFQGTLLTDFDVETMFRALRIPIEKLKDKELESARERVTCMKWELGHLPQLEKIKDALKEGFSEIFNVELVEREMTKDEKKLLEEKLENFQSDSWIYGVRRPIEHRQVLTSAYKAPGGLIRTSLVADIPNKRIQAALITGDFFAHPKRIILDLEGMMKDAVLEKNAIEKMIHGFFSERDVQIPGVTPEDFIKAINKALDKINYIKLGIPIENVNRVFTVVKPINEITEPPVLLLPYCSKLVECELRHKNECTKCSLCTIGDAYEAAEENEMKPITILSFENLMETLHDLKKKGVKTFVGSCCEAFYIKHLEDFEEAGLPGVLVDIDSTTCYDLEKVKEAELGSFEGQTHLNMDLINKVLEVLKSRK